MENVRLGGTTDGGDGHRWRGGGEFIILSCIYLDVSIKNGVGVEGGGLGCGRGLVIGQWQLVTGGGGGGWWGGRGEGVAGLSVRG